MLHFVRRPLLVQLLSVYLLFAIVVLLGGVGVNAVVEQALVQGISAQTILTKPFGVEELLARVRAVLRRTQWEATPPTGGIKRFGDLEIDLSGHTLRLRGAEVRLLPTEFALLE